MSVFGNRPQGRLKCIAVRKHLAVNVKSRSLRSRDGFASFLNELRSTERLP